MESQSLILVSDPRSISWRNFRSIRSLLSESGLELVHDEFPHLKRITASPYDVEPVEQHDLDEILTRNWLHKGFDLLEIIYPAMLSQIGCRGPLRASSRWSRRELGSFFIQSAPRTVRGYIALTIFWLDHWGEFLSRHEAISEVLIFSGTSVDQIALASICKAKDLPFTLLEHDLTGGTILLNATQEQKELCESLIGADLGAGFEWLKQAENPLGNKNVNVNAPEGNTGNSQFSLDTTILLIGQATSDASFVKLQPSFSSTRAYEKFIARVMAETRMNVLIRTHPWEEKKLGEAFTAKALDSFVRENNLGSRVTVTDSGSLEFLIDACKEIVTISSQSAITAMIRGRDVSLIGAEGYVSSTHFAQNLPSPITDLNSLYAIIGRPESQPIPQGVEYKFWRETWGVSIPKRARLPRKRGTPFRALILALGRRFGPRLLHWYRGLEA